MREDFMPRMLGSLSRWVCDAPLKRERVSRMTRSQLPKPEKAGNNVFVMRIHTPTIRRLVLVSALLCQNSVAGVIGDDDRRAPLAEESELVRALGHVFCSKVVSGQRRRSAGTATVVGSPNTILTAAHVFVDRAGPRGPEVRFDPIGDCVFRQFDVDGNISVEVEFLYADMGEFHQNPGLPNQDWAVLRTAAPLPNSATALSFANSVSEFEGLIGLPIKILAFHADIETARRTPLLSEGRLLSVDYGGYRRLAHTADMGRMSSGAAIVHRTAVGKYVVVGVNRSSANLGEFNLAVPLSIELEELLRSYAWGQVPQRNQRLATTLQEPYFF